MHNDSWRTPFFFALLAMISCVTSAQAVPAPPLPPLPGVDIHVNGYLPAPPGVRIYYSDSRPYYVEGGRRVYLEKDHKHKKNHGKGHGLKKGHYKHHK